MHEICTLQKKQIVLKIFSFSAFGKPTNFKIRDVIINTILLLIRSYIFHCFYRILVQF